MTPFQRDEIKRLALKVLADRFMGVTAADAWTPFHTYLDSLVSEPQGQIMCQECLGSGNDSNKYNDPGPCPACRGEGYLKDQPNG